MEAAGRGPRQGFPRALRGHTRARHQPDHPAAYDLETLADDIQALYDHLSIECAYLLGDSISGLVVQTFAARYPERVRRLVLANTTWRYGQEARDSWNKRIEMAEAGQLETVVDGTLERFLTADFREAQAERILPLRTAMLAVDPKGFAGCCAALRDADLGHLHPTLTMPVFWRLPDSRTSRRRRKSWPISSLACRTRVSRSFRALTCAIRKPVRIQLADPAGAGVMSLASLSRGPDLAPDAVLLDAATRWLGALEAALAVEGVPDLAGLFREECHWRDILVFGQDVVTVDGIEAITALVSQDRGRARPNGFSIPPNAPRPASSCARRWTSWSSSSGPNRTGVRRRASRGRWRTKAPASGAAIPA